MIVISHSSCQSALCVRAIYPCPGILLRAQKHFIDDRPKKNAWLLPTQYKSFTILSRPGPLNALLQHTLPASLPEASLSPEQVAVCGGRSTVQSSECARSSGETTGFLLL